VASLGSLLDRVLGAVEARRRRRSFNTQDQASRAWDDRAVAAVGLLAAAPAIIPVGERLRIADLGAGNQRLRSVLQAELGAPFEYHAYDLRPQAQDVQRIDVEKAMPELRFDVVFCLGLLEYLRDLESFARRLRTTCGHAVVSYVITDPPGSLSPDERRRRGWLTDFARADLERLFGECGHVREASTLTNAGSTALWLWSTSWNAPVSGT
jgi:hypothetical protein